MSLRYKQGFILLWLVLCVPLLFLGYGSDFDAWRVAQCAADIWEEHRYVPSRSLGNPLHEFALAPLVSQGGWVAGNAFSLAFALLFLLGLLRLEQQGHFRHAKMLLVSLAFLPIIMKNATSTMDYIPALAMLIWSYLFLQESRWHLAALLLGVACGFRPTSLLFLIPLLYHVQAVNKDISTTVRSAALALFSAVLFYAPLLAAESFVLPAPVHRSSWLLQAGQIGFHALRTLGVGQALLAALLLLVFARKHEQTLLHRTFVRFHLLNMAVWSALFVFLPDEPEYLLPAIPSLIFLSDRLLPRRAFAALMLLLLSYHVIQLDLRSSNPLDLKPNPHLRSGWSIEDVQDRCFKLSFRAAADAASMKHPTVLMYGLPWAAAVNPAWSWEPDMKMFAHKKGNLYLSTAIQDRARIGRLTERGFRLVAWRTASWETVQMGFAGWPGEIEVIEDIRQVFDTPIRGKALNER